jgi:dihydropteroate synthase
MIDPGIGFGKKFDHNIQLLRELRSFTSLDYPLLAGVSRKAFLGAIMNLPPNDRVEGTAAAVTASILNGANIIRVHDVKEMKRSQPRQSRFLFRRSMRKTRSQNS